ncbi:TRZ/ATZ family hydrolase [Sulfuriflexus sp.]|uniref:TRZ/ATZ family hydrolase n=1 Tax=Sulfuriflexus sp. TaxID=2015443 RepID=UPI0028CC0E89|nr:TRZ/ATZ family hydrolase [Sulfuriflexus sp.]MDT8403713.1 TRZ/ATZ family hydrolase [Sulfuriflexus sp.]
MNNIDLLLHARWLVTVDADDRVLDNHCLAIQAGEIIDILPTAEAATRYVARQQQYFEQHVLMPGMINTHTHAAMNLMRGIADDLPLMEWLEQHIWPTEARWVSSEFVRDGTRLAIAEMLRGGTTCFNDMYFFPDEVARVASEAGIRASIGLIVIDFPTVWANDAGEYISKGLQVHDQVRDNALITTAFAPHAPYTVSDAPLQKLNMLAEELDIPVHMHVHETSNEVNTALKNNGQRPLDRLHELGLLSPRLLAVHMTQLSAADIQLVAATGTHILHCPASNLKLASGFCPVQDLLDAGVNVCLGTDGAASNNGLDMFGEIRLAALLAKGVSANPCSVDAFTALRMATINGARALGIDDITGSLETGKAADVIAIDLAHIETQPTFEPVSQIVYATGRQHVSDVWIAGRQLLRDGVLTTMDEKALLDTARAWTERILQEAD